MSPDQPSKLHCLERINESLSSRWRFLVLERYTYYQSCGSAVDVEWISQIGENCIISIRNNTLRIFDILNIIIVKIELQKLTT